MAWDPANLDSGGKGWAMQSIGICVYPRVGSDLKINTNPLLKVATDLILLPYFSPKKHLIWEHFLLWIKNKGTLLQMWCLFHSVWEHQWKMTYGLLSLFLHFLKVFLGSLVWPSLCMFSLTFRTTDSYFSWVKQTTISEFEVFSFSFEQLVYMVTCMCESISKRLNT